MGYRKFRLHQRKNAERKRLKSRKLKSVQGRPKRQQRNVCSQTQVILSITFIGYDISNYNYFIACRPHLILI